MPGVLQVEALAQLAGIICLQMEGAEPGMFRFMRAVPACFLANYALFAISFSAKI